MTSLIIVTLSLTSIISNTQQENFDFKDLKFRGLDFNSTERAIVKSFGKGKKVSVKYNDCGEGFSSDRGQFYKLNYNGFTFRGNDKEGYFLESVNFDVAGKIKITYKGNVFSGLTTKPKLLTALGKVNPEESFFSDPIEPGVESIIVGAEPYDNGVKFTLKNGQLIRFNYWESCNGGE
ncbi:MAG: hypothetical protein O9262_07045 [Cyclobacteriaceae bacterium]|nr:hypothetical protein [Cyclobacteriaceae bacterium]